MKETMTGLIEMFLEVVSDDYQPWQPWELSGCDFGGFLDMCGEPFSVVGWGVLGAGTIRIQGGGIVAPLEMLMPAIHIVGADVTPRPTLKEGVIHISGNAAWSHVWNPPGAGVLHIVGVAAVESLGVVTGAGSVTVQGSATTNGTGAYLAEGIVHVAGHGAIELAANVLASGIVHVSGAAAWSHVAAVVGAGGLRVQGGALLSMWPGYPDHAVAGVVRIVGAKAELEGGIHYVSGAIHIVGKGTLPVSGIASPAGVIHIVGAATWSFTAGGPPTPGTDCNSALAITIGTPYTYTIGTTATHWFKFPIVNGTTYKVSWTINSGHVGAGSVWAGTTCGGLSFVGSISAFFTCASFTASVTGYCWVQIPGDMMAGPGNYTMTPGTGSCP